MKPADATSGGGSDGEDDAEGGGDGPETRGQMLQRHKRVGVQDDGTGCKGGACVPLVSAASQTASGRFAARQAHAHPGCLRLHAQEMLAHKKALQRSGKKSKDDITRLTAGIEKRHAEELKQLDEGVGSHTDAAAGDGGKAASAAPSGQAVAAVGSAAEAGDPLSKYMKNLAVGDEGAGQARVSVASSWGRPGAGPALAECSWLLAQVTHCQLRQSPKEILQVLHTLCVLKVHTHTPTVQRLSASLHARPCPSEAEQGAEAAREARGARRRARGANCGRERGAGHA